MATGPLGSPSVNLTPRQPGRAPPAKFAVRERWKHCFVIRAAVSSKRRCPSRGDTPAANVLMGRAFPSRLWDRAGNPHRRSSHRLGLTVRNRPLTYLTRLIIVSTLLGLLGLLTSGWRRCWLRCRCPSRSLDFPNEGELRRAQILWWNVRRFGAVNIGATPTVAASSECHASLLHSWHSGAGFSERGLLRPRLSHDAKF
jgi:hypothetical protein